MDKSLDESTTLETDSDSAILPPGLKLLNTCLNELKLVTRRYSKKQIKWVNNRMLASRDRQVPDLYELDSSDVSKWKETVLERAINVIDCYRKGEVCEIQPMPKRIHPGEGLNQETSHYCEQCRRHFIGDFQWRSHLTSNKHKHGRFKKSGNGKVQKRSQSSVQSTMNQTADNETK